MPRYKASPPAEELPQAPAAPELKLCQVSDGRMLIPRDIRQSFLGCPIYGPEWRDLLKAFDSDWGVQVPAVSDSHSPAGKNTSSPSRLASGPGAKKEEEDTTAFWKKYFPFSDDIQELAGPDASTKFVLTP